MTPRSNGDHVKVLYIAGWGRSGTTLVDNILGQFDGVVSCGELVFLWRRGLRDRRFCGCGVPLPECPLWRQILSQAAELNPSFSPERMLELEEHFSRTRHFARCALGAMATGARRSRLFSEYCAGLASLYEAIGRVTGSRVIVDSSKSPAYAAVLANIPELDLLVVHMTRDPRAVAHSWLRKKAQPDRGDARLMHRHGPAYSSVMWTLYNVTLEALSRRYPSRFIHTRYEDFVARPRETIDRLIELTGKPVASTPFLSERVVRLAPSHTVSGNPSRFRTGSIDITPDEEWRTQLGRRQRLVATAGSLALLRRYGYPLRMGSTREGVAAHDGGAR